MGCMVTRYRVEDAKGRVLTIFGEFAYETDDVMEFSDEDDATEEAKSLPGTSVEKFWRYSEHADFVFGHNAASRVERRFGREGA